MGTKSFGPFLFEPELGRLLRNGSALPVGVRAVPLLKALLEANGEPVTKGALIDAAWPAMTVEEVNLSVQIAALRKALGKRPDGEEWITTVPRIGYRLLRPAEVEKPSAGPKAAVAVLPFESLSDGPSPDYFADGIVEDLINALSRFKTFAVIARNASFAYRGKDVDLREAARFLGVRYVLTGSVRRAANRIRVSTQLVEGASGNSLWAERFDGNVEDVFDMQDRITEQVVGLVEPQIRKAEIERVRSARPDSMDAYDLYLRALPCFYGVPDDRFATAIDLLERAVALDPEYAVAVAHAAWAHEKRYTLGLPPLHHDPKRCVALARAGLRSAPDNPVVIAICSQVLLITGGRSGRLACLETVTRARAANPNSVLISTIFGGMLIGGGGDLEIALEALHHSYDLSPGAPELHQTMTYIGSALYYLGRHQEALEWLRRAFGTGQAWQPTYWHLAAVHEAMGNAMEMNATIKELHALAPQSSLAHLRKITAESGYVRYETDLYPALERAGLRLR